MSGEPERFEPDKLADPPAEFALARLPAGRHGLPRSFVAQNQRLRIIAAMLRTLPEHGYHDTTIAHLTGEAGVSRAAFYEHFDGKEQCFLETYDLASQWLCERVEVAVAGEEEWPAQLRAGAAELLRLLAANPVLARLVSVEVPQAGPAARKRQRARLARFADFLRAGRPHRQELPAGLEELLLGGAIALIGRYAEAGRAEQLPDLSTELVQCLLMPYLGRRVAARAA
ncbi:MAG: TetR/AcrR family transcriptional regulator [Solirubrobacterales bacterium]